MSGNNQTTNLNSDHIGRLLVKLSVPAFLSMFVTTTYSIVNTIFLGRYVGSMVIAAVAMVFPIQGLMWRWRTIFGSVNLCGL